MSKDSHGWQICQENSNFRAYFDDDVFNDVMHCVTMSAPDENLPLCNSISSEAESQRHW